MKESPKCNDCGQPMIEVGDIGKVVQIIDVAGIERGMRHAILYQCPEDKTIAID